MQTRDPVQLRLQLAHKLFPSLGSKVPLVNVPSLFEEVVTVNCGFLVPLLHWAAVWSPLASPTDAESSRVETASSAGVFSPGAVLGFRCACSCCKLTLYLKRLRLE